MRIAYFFILIFFLFTVRAQNLVPNYSFESYSTCPTAGQLYNLPPWCGLAGGEDSFNTCCNVNGPFANGVPHNLVSGFQYPRTGNGYGSVMIFGKAVAGYPPNRREYIQAPLNDTLQAGKVYCGTAYVNVLNESMICTDRIGMYYSANGFACNQAFPLPQYIAPLNLIPQVENPPGNVITDTLNWIEVSGTFTATGTEQYVTIGNFYDDANTFTVTTYPNGLMNWNYLLIDDVSLEEVHTAQCTHDTILCSPDSVLLGSNVSEAAIYNWSPATGLSCTSCPNPKALVNQTTTYTLTKKQCKVTTTAQVKVTIADTCNQVPVFTIPNVFTPNEDGTNDTFTFSGKGITIHTVIIYNRWGNIMYAPELRDKKVFNWDGRTTSGEKASDGTYFYLIEYTDSKGQQLKKNGYISLFR